MAVRRVVKGRFGSWYRLLEFRNGSVVTTTGFTIYDLLHNDTKEELRGNISNILSLFEGNVSLLVDRNSIVISREFFSMLFIYLLSIRTRDTQEKRKIKQTNQRKKRKKGWRHGAVGRVSNLRSRGRGFESRPGTRRKNSGHAHTYVPLFTKHYKLVPAKGR